MPPVKPAQAPVEFTEPNALMQWLMATWANIKQGKFGGTRYIAILLAIVLIGAAWWFLSSSSRKAESALWTNFSLAVSNERMKSFLDSEGKADSKAAKIVRLNQARDKAQTNMRQVFASKLATRQKAASDLATLVLELEAHAKEFPDDKSLKAAALLAAAEAEKVLIGIPKENADPLKLDSAENSRGQISKYVALLKEAAEVLGPTTEAGKSYLATAEKFEKNAEEQYKYAFSSFSNFNNADPVLPSSGIDETFDPDR